MQAELLEIARNLGFNDEGTYLPSDVCVEAIAELKSYLAGADDIVARYIAFHESKILSKVLAH